MPALHSRLFAVTGTTTGIGRETAARLGAWGASVVCANRDVARSRATAPPGRLEHPPRGAGSTCRQAPGELTIVEKRNTFK